MSWLNEMLQGVPLNAVLKERVQLAEQKYKLMEDENQSLKSCVEQLEKENSALRSELGTIKTKESSRPKLQGDFYKFEGEEGFFCTNCFDSAGKKVRTVQVIPRVRECPQCKTVIDR